MALNGVALVEGTTFHPQNNEQAYLAYAVGLIADPSELPEPRTATEVLLYEYCLNGGGGTPGELPALINPATAALILEGYEAINGSGRKVTGTMRDNGDMHGELSPHVDTYPIRAGYHSGNGEVTVRSGGITITPTDKEQIIEADDEFFDTVIVEAAPEGEGGPMVTGLKASGVLFGNWQADHLDLRGLDVSALTDGTSLFREASGIASIDVTGWDVSKMTSMNHMFYVNKGIAKIIGMDTWETDALTDMSSMFQSATKLTSIDLSGFNTSKVTTLSQTFDGCSSLEEIIGLEDLDTSAMTQCGRLFYGCAKLKEIDLSKWDVSKLKSNFNSTFYGCSALKRVNLTGWDVAKIKQVSQTFYGCTSLEEIVGLADIGTDAINNMSGTFANCKLIKVLDLSKWNFGALVAIDNAFSGCTALEEVVGLENIPTGNVTTMAYTFQNCGLKSIDMSLWDTSLVTNMNGMFSGAAVKEIIGFSAMNKAGVTIGFPVGTSSKASGLKRLTFRTDVANPIRSAIDIKYNQMERSGAVEMFNSLPDVSALTHSANYKKITLTGNPCVSSTFKIPEKSGVPVSSYAEYAAAADEFYGNFDRTGAQIKGFVDGVGWELVDATNVNEDFFNYSQVSFLEFTATVSDSMKLTDEDRAIATGKGWTLVE